MENSEKVKGRLEKSLMIEKIKASFVKYQMEAMFMIEKRREAEKMIMSAHLFSKYSPDQLKEKFNKSIGELEQGHITSEYFDHLTAYYPLPDQPKVVGRPKLCYQLRNGKSGSQALLDILSNEDKNFLMVIDCRMAAVIAQYYAVFKMLQEILGNDEGAKVFDAICCLENERMLLSRFPIFDGTRNFCVLENSMIKPLNLLFYFFKSKNGDLKPGNRMYYLNHQDYMKKFPLGSDQGYTLICTSINPPKFIGFELGYQPLTEAEIRDIAVKNYNIPRPAWMLSKSVLSQMPYDTSMYGKEPCLDKISSGQVPGITDNRDVDELDDEKVYQLLTKPTATIEKLKSWIAIEKEVVRQRRQVEFGYRLKGCSTPLLELIIQPPNYATFIEQIEKNKVTANEFYHKSEFDRALLHFRLTLGFARKLYTHYENAGMMEKMIETELTIATCCYKISSCYDSKNQLKEARPFLKEAYEILVNLKGDSFPLTQEVKARIEQCEEIDKKVQPTPVVKCGVNLL
jgi:hypothetical protein